MTIKITYGSWNEETTLTVHEVWSFVFGDLTPTEVATTLTHEDISKDIAEAIRQGLSLPESQIRGIISDRLCKVL